MLCYSLESPGNVNFYHRSKAFRFSLLRCYLGWINWDGGGNRLQSVLFCKLDDTVRARDCCSDVLPIRGQGPR